MRSCPASQKVSSSNLVLRSYLVHVRRNCRNYLASVDHVIIRSRCSTTYMRPIDTHGVAWSVCQSVCLSVTVVSRAKPAKHIEMTFEMWNWVDQRKRVLDGSAHWRNLANTIEPFMRGGDAALCQITLITC